MPAKSSGGPKANKVHKSPQHVKGPEPEGNQTGQSQHVPKPASFYAEEDDMQEPAEEEVEKQIQEDVRACKQHLSTQPLSLDLVLQHHALDDELVVSSSEDKAFFFQQLTHLRLDRMHLEGDLPHTVLSALPRLTHVYLQHNQLTSMAGLCTLPRLRFAALSHNRIKQVEGVAGLPTLMFLDLSHNQLQSLDVQQLPQSVGFLKIAGNPCTSAGSGSFKEALQAHLPRLRDLDGPVSEDEDNDSSRGSRSTGDGGSVSSSIEAEGGSDDVDGLLGGVAEVSDLGGERTVPPLPLVGEEGLPVRGKARTREGTWVGAADGAGPSSRLVRSALDMLEELERVCYASAARTSSTSLRASMSRAMRSVADHPAMRSWRGAAGEGAMEGLPGTERGKGMRTSLGNGRGDAGAPAGLLSRPSSGSASADLASRATSAGGMGQLEGCNRRPPSATRAHLRPVTPPLLTSLASLQEPPLGARIGVHDPPWPVTGLAGRPLSGNPGAGRGQRPMEDTEQVLQRHVDDDLDRLRRQLQELTEPLAAAAAHRPPGLPGVALCAPGNSAHPAARNVEDPAGAPRTPDPVPDASAAKQGALGAQGGGSGRVSSRGGGDEGPSKAGRGSVAGRGRGAAAGKGAATGRGGGSGRGRGAAGAGRGDRPAGRGGGKGVELAKQVPASQKAAASMAGRGGASEVAGSTTRPLLSGSLHVPGGGEAEDGGQATDGGFQGDSSGSSSCAAGPVHLRPSSAASAGRTLLWSASSRRPPSAAADASAAEASATSRPASACMRPASGVGVRPGSAVAGAGSKGCGLQAGGAEGGEAAGVTGRAGAAPDSSAPASGLGSRPAEAPGQPDPQPSTWLREEVERKKAAAAARLAAQRAQQEALSVAIRAMRGTSAGEDGQGQGSAMAQLRSSLTLRAAVEAGPGSADAVRAAISSLRSNQDCLALGGAGGLVSAALNGHEAEVAASPYGTRAAAVADQDKSLRSSMARLRALTDSTKAALALRHGPQEQEQMQAEGVQGDDNNQDREGTEGGGQGPSKSSSKYAQLIRARTQARSAAIPEESEEVAGGSELDPLE